MVKRMMLIALMLFAASDSMGLTWKDPETGLEWTYTLSQGSAIVGNINGSAWALPETTVGSVVIPATIDGYKVKGIGSEAFYNCKDLTSVVIPSGVTSIGSYAFSGCSGLTSVNVPSSVTSVGSGAFRFCSGVRNAVVPGWGCGIPFSSVTNLMISAGTKCIVAKGFYGCNELISVTIPTGVTSIGSEAFSDCTELSSVVIPSSVTNIDNLAFRGCIKLVSIDLPVGVVSIGAAAFWGCCELRLAEIPSSVKSIGESAFSGCSGLTTVTIHDGVESIGDDAFSGCSGLTSVKIPISLISVGRHAFSGCNGICDVIVPGWKCGMTFSSVTNLVISEGTTCVGASAFSGCDQLTSVTIPAGVTNIESAAFSTCSALTTVKVPSTVMCIGSDVFSGCSGLKSVEIPSSITSIGNGVFRDCSELSSVEIPAGVTNIGDYAFFGCSELTSLVIPSGVSSIGKYAFSNCGGLTSVEIPPSVTCIEDGMFCGCNGLTSVGIPWSVTNVAAYAFSGCNRLMAVKIPDRVTSIGEYAFAYCHGLTSVVIPSNVKCIRWCAFYRCSGITNVEIQFGVTGIDKLAFTGCDAVRNAVVPGWKCGIPFSSVTNLTISEGTTYVEYEAFSECEELATVKFPSSLIEIGSCAFSGCSKLRTVDIPFGVTRIGTRAFSECIGLMSVSIPLSVTGFGSDVFSGCGGVLCATVPGWTCGIPFASVTNLVISDGTTHIISSAFSDCNGLVSVTIPLTVESVATDAFANCGGLMSIFVDADNPCFESVDGLVLTRDRRTLLFGVNGEIEIPSGVANIANNAFWGRTGLSRVAIPSSVTNVGRHAFSGCDGLMGVDIASIDEWMSISFEDAEANPLHVGAALYVDGVEVTDLEIPEGTTEIGEYGFQGGQFASVRIPCSVTNIAETAFLGCVKIASVIVPSDLNVSSSFPDSRRNLTSVVIADVNGDIPFDAYNTCSSLKAISIPEGVEAVGAGAFRGCSSLVRLWLPSTLGTIGDVAFVNCENLSRVDIPSITDWLAIRFDGCWSNPLYAGAVLFVDGEEVTDLVIPEGVTEIGDYKFFGCACGSVAIPSSVTNVAYGAFSSCTNIIWATVPSNFNVASAFRDSLSRLESVAIVDVNGAVPSGAYRNCLALKEISIPEGVKDVGSKAFQHCSSLSHVSLPSGLEIIGRDAFVGCENLSRVDISSVADWLAIQFENAEANPLHTGAALNVDGKEVSELVIPEGTTEIGEYAFLNGAYESVTIPESVTNVSATAFVGCTNIMSLIVPSSLHVASVFRDSQSRIASVTIVGINGEVPSGAYRNCSALKSITVPEGVSNMGTEAFSGCLSLSRVNLPTGLDSIGRDAFAGCVSLSCVDSPSLADWLAICFENGAANPLCYGASLHVGGEEVTELVIPAGTTCVGDYAFQGGRFVSVSVPAECASVSELAFAGCAHVTALSVPICIDVANTFSDSLAQIESVRILGDIGDIPVGAYRNCSSLRSIIVPAGTANIGDNTFAGCVSLTSVSIPSSVTNIAATAFAGCSNIVSVMLGEGLSPERRIGAQLEGATDWTVEAELLEGEPIYRSNAISHSGSTSVEFVIPAGMEQLKFSWKVASESNCDWLTWYLDGVEKDRISGNKDWRTVTNVLDGAEHRVKFVYSKDVSVSTSPDCGWVSIGSVAVVCDATMAELFPDAYRSVRELSLSVGENCPDGEFLDGCTSLVSVTLPSELASAAVGQSCMSLESVVLTDVPEKIDDRLFADCVRLSSFVVPDGTVEIGEEAFADCTALSSVTIPASVKRIGANAFVGCTALTSLTLPSGLVDFGLDSIPEHQRTSMGYDDDGFMIYNGWLLDYDDKTVSSLVVPEGVIGIGRSALADMEDLETVELPSSLKYIGENAFRLDTYLDNVVIPDSVEVIGKGAFEMCTWIQTLTLGAGVKMVEDRAFATCSSLYRATFADGLESIGEAAFADCESMMSVALPLSVTQVASSAFTGCKRLTGVTTPSSVAPLSDWFAPVYTQIKDVTIPSGEALVCSNMFRDCSSLISVALPEGVTNVASGAFWNCTALPSVVLPSSLVTIGDSAFRNCNALTAVGLPDSVKCIGTYAFYDCSNLADVSLSKSLREIPAYAFANTGLDSLVVPATVTNLGTRFCGGAARAIYYLGAAPTYAEDAYASTLGSLVSYVKNGTKGWDGIPSSRHLPDNWPVGNSYSRSLATWSPVQFDVTFDAGEGLFASVSSSQYACEQIKGTAYSLPPFNPTRKGYKFAGWWTESVGGTQVTPSTGVKLDRGHMLYAHWTESAIVTVRFNACGGTVLPDEAEYTAEVPFGAFPVPTREHYVFVGWYTAASGGTRMRESTEVPKADRELFAQWTPAHYLIRFNANNGSAASVCQDYIYGQTVTLRANTFSCAGCQFAGWSLTPGGAAVYADGKTISELAAIEDGVMDLYAVWTGNVYAVRFDSHGGYGVMPNQTFVIGIAMPLSPCSFTRQGYVFKGWAESTTAEASYGDGQTVCDLTHQQAGTVVLYAVWERDATADPIPDLGDTPSAADVTNAVADAADPQVKAKVDAANYNDFRNWAGKVKTTGGSDAGAQGVMNADNAWLSYALGQGTLLEEAPTDADLSVETFKPAAETGKFDFTVSVGTIQVSSEAAKENLKKVFGLEGGTTLNEGGLSPDNVDITFGTPMDGKVKFTAGPNAKNADAKTFFMKVKMTP